MHKLAGGLLVVAACAFWVAATAAPPANVLVGTWVLDRFVDTVEGREPTYSYGKHPIGQFMFGPDGRFSINIMRDPPVDDPADHNPDPGDDNTPRWVVAYFGTYRYDPSGPRWTAHVLGGNIRSYLGTDQVRDFKISGDVMTISGTYLTADHHNATFVRVLHRVK